TSSAADAVATWDEEAGELAVFVVNRSNQEELALDADLASFGELELVEALTLHHEDPYAANTKDAPETVVPQANDSLRLEAGRLAAAVGATHTGPRASGSTGPPAPPTDGPARVVIDLDLPGATISRHLYGHFAEHLGRCIYGGFYVGEDSEIPNTRGIRDDV